VEAWVFTGPPGRVLSFSADLALAVPMMIGYGARRAWRALARPRSAPADDPGDDQSSSAA
jgi:hypothetical protein